MLSGRWSKVEVCFAPPSGNVVSFSLLRTPLSILLTKVRISTDTRDGAHVQYTCWGYQRPRTEAFLVFLHKLFARNFISVQSEDGLEHSTVAGPAHTPDHCAATCGADNLLELVPFLA